LGAYPSQQKALIIKK